MRALAGLIAKYYLRKPDLAELLYLKYPRPSFLGAALANELCFLLKLDRSHKLTGLNVELTNRCNLSCGHCPRTRPGSRPECDMDFDTFRSIIDPLPDLRTLLPFQWGEPLMSPILYDCIAYARNRGIQVMLTTNGTLLDEEASRKLCEADLTRLTVSFDGSPEQHARWRNVNPDRIIENVSAFKRVRDKMGASCALDVSMVVDEETLPFVEEFKRLFKNSADRLQLIPRFVEKLRTKPCRELWRGVLVVLSNGDVTICCADPQGYAVIGNVRDATVAELYNCKAMKHIRRTHREGRFEGICKTCSEFHAPGISPRFS